MFDPSTVALEPGQPALHLTASADPASPSRWGGIPHVPADWQWPLRADGTPLSFLGQIDLAQSQSALALDFLPGSGLLLFFYDTQDQPWGFDPDDRDGFKVEYFAPGTPLEPASIPQVDGEQPDQWPACPIAFHTIETYEDRNPIVKGGVELSDNQTETLVEFVYDRTYGDHPHHQMGGHPDPIQNPNMQDECELASNQINVGGSDGYNSGRGQALLAAGGAKDWRLVLQVDTDDGDAGPGWMWGDSGMLYFWVKGAQGRRGDFTNAWLVLQCC